MARLMLFFILLGSEQLLHVSDVSVITRICRPNQSLRCEADCWACKEIRSRSRVLLLLMLTKI